MDPLENPEQPVPGANVPPPPLPEQRPPMPVQNFGQQQGDPSALPALQSVTTERAQSDPSHLLVADVLMAGMLPYAQAAADVATGKIPPDQFDAARQEHERIIKALRDEHPDLVSAAEQAAPLVAGLGMSVAKPAATVAGTAARGMGAGAATGYVQGYTSGPTEEPSVSSTRMGQGLGRAAVTAVIGGVGAAAPDAIKGVKGALNDRATRKAAEQVAQQAADKKRAAAAKGAATRAQKKADAETAKREAQALNQRAKAEAAELERLTKQAETYRTPPPKEGLHKDWENNRRIFERDPVHVFNQMDGLNMDGFAKMVNLPKAAILEKLAGKELTIDTPGKQYLLDELNEINKGWQALRKSGGNTNMTTPKKPTNETADSPPPKRGTPEYDAENNAYRADRYAADRELRELEKVNGPRGNADRGAGGSSTSSTSDAGASSAARGSGSSAGGSAKPARKRASSKLPEPTPRVSGSSAERKRRRVDDD